MRKILMPSLALAIASIGLSAMAGEVESGLAIGESTKAFNVKDITGPNKGTSLCYR